MKSADFISSKDYRFQKTPSKPPALNLTCGHDWRTVLTITKLNWTKREGINVCGKTIKETDVTSPSTILSVRPLNYVAQNYQKQSWSFLSRSKDVLVRCILSLHSATLTLLWSTKAPLWPCPVYVSLGRSIFPCEEPRCHRECRRRCPGQFQLYMIRTFLQLKILLWKEHWNRSYYAKFR